MKMKKKQFRASKASPRLEDWANRLNPDDLELIEQKTRYKGNQKRNVKRRNKNINRTFNRCRLY